MNFVKQPAKMGRDGKNTCSPSLRTHLFSFRSRSLPAPPPPARPRERVASLEAASRIPRACLRPCPPDLPQRPPFPRARSPTRGRSPPRYPRNPTSFPGREDSCSKSHNAATPLEKTSGSAGTSANHFEKESSLLRTFSPVRLFYFFSRGRKFYECEF